MDTATTRTGLRDYSQSRSAGAFKPWAETRRGQAPAYTLTQGSLPEPVASGRLTVRTIAGRPFRQPQSFAVAKEQGLWVAHGPFGVHVYAEREQDLFRELVEYLDLIWDDYVVQNIGMLSGDAIALRNELLAAVT